MTSRTNPGDALAKDPLMKLTYSIEIGADPEQIWSWIIQMG
jgi:hypothetical protein